MSAPIQPLSREQKLADMLHFPLAEAFLCQDCHAIGNWAVQCPACASTHLLSMANVLDRSESATEAPAYAEGETWHGVPVERVDEWLRNELTVWEA